MVLVIRVFGCSAENDDSTAGEVVVRLLRGFHLGVVIGTVSWAEERTHTRSV